MRWLRFTTLVLFAAVLQAGVLTNMNIAPNLLLILLVFFCIYGDSGQAIITSFAIGFAADLVGSPMPMGPYTISFGLLGTALAYVHHIVNVKKMPYQGLVIFVTAFLAGALAHILALLKGRPLAPNLWTGLFGMSTYSALVGPFLFLPSAWWMRIKTGRLARQAYPAR